MKTILLIAVFLISLVVLEADSRTPYGESPLKYLSSKSAVVYVIKSSGGLSYSDYSEPFHEMNSLSREKIKDDWVNHAFTNTEKYLIVRIIKGSTLTVGQEISIGYSEEYGLTSVGSSYILFLNKESSNYSFHKCDIAELNDYSVEEIYRLTELKIKDITSELISSYKMRCTNKLIKRNKE